MLWKCSVCGMTVEGENPPSVCPKCGAPSEMFSLLSEDDANKIYSSDRTNDIHMEIIHLCGRIVNLCNEGIKINLDPGCLSSFEKAKDEAWIIKQRSKAELDTHVSKKKW